MLYRNLRGRLVRGSQKKPRGNRHKAKCFHCFHSLTFHGANRPRVLARFVTSTSDSKPSRSFPMTANNPPPLLRS